MTVHAPAAAVLERVNPAVCVVEAVDADSCVLDTGDRFAGSLAVHLGMLGYAFTVTGPPELVAHLEDLAGRYARSTRPPSSADPEPGKSAFSGR